MVKRRSELLEDQENVRTMEDGNGDVPLDGAEEEAVRPRSKRARHAAVPGLSERDANTQQAPLEHATQAPATYRPTQGHATQQRAPTQARASQLRPLPGLRTEGTAGQLKHIRLEDFMCHRCFEMEFGPHITLVSGKNGSGKSAVMQALQVSLGVSARSTGRGTNLTGFIRYGASEARVMVTIWNKGPEAFEHDKFGDFITVERRITHNSGGSYSLKNAAGRVVPSNSDMQNALRDHFAIDAANPLTIVTQDMARSFLSGTREDNRKKYMMFMQGTLLYKIQDHLAEARRCLTQSKECIAKVKEEKAALDAQLAEVTSRIGQLEDLDAQAVRLLQIEQVKGWALVDIAEQEIANYQEMLDGMPENEEKLRDEIENAERLATAAKKQAEAVGAEMNRSRERNEEAKQELQEIKGRVTAARMERQALESQAKGLRQELQEATGMVEQCKAELLKGTDNAKVAQAKAQLQEFEEKVKATHDKIEAHQQETTQHRTSFHQLSEKKEELLANVTHLGREATNLLYMVNDLEKQRQELEQAKRNRVMVFGRPVATMLDLVKKNIRRFEYAPIGPIGMYLNLSDPKWAVAVEKCIGPKLTSFICFSKQDAEYLRILARQANATYVSVLQTRPGIPPHNITRRPLADPRYLTVLDVLHVTDTSVSTPIINTLVDSSKVDMTVLVDNDEEGRRLVYHSPHIQKISVVTMLGMALNKSDEHNKSVIPRDQSSNRPPRVGMDSNQQVQQVEQLLLRRQAELAEKRAKLDEAKQKLHVHERLLSTANQAAVAAQIAKRDATRALTHIQQQQRQLQPHADEDREDARINAVTQSMQDAQVDLTKLQVTVEEKQLELDEAVRREEALHESFLELRKQVQEQHSDLRPFMDQLSQAAEAEGGANTRKQALEAELKDLLEQREATQQLLDNEQEHLPLAKENAQAVCSREEAEEAKKDLQEYMVEKKHAEKRGNANAFESMQPEEQKDYIDAAMSFESLDAEYSRLNQHRRVQEQNLGSKEELESQYRQLNKQAVLKNRDYNAVKSTQAVLIQSFQNRIKRLQSLRENVERTCNEKFHMYLSRRGHLGQLTLNHDEEAVKLKVKVNGIANPNSPWTTDLKQLSGGERSYTTVAFLLALGQWSESTFRCLDEFDVFMDPVNRRIAVETLMQSAMEMTDKQYVLLTPQDIQAIEDARQMLEQKKRVQLPPCFLKTVAMRPPRT